MVLAKHETHNQKDHGRRGLATGVPLKGTYKHVTAAAKADSVLANGFRSSPKHKNDHWGPGIYLALDDAASVVYQDGVAGTGTVHTEVDLKNPLVGKTFDDIAAQVEPEYGKFRKQGDSPGAALGKAARSKGYDGIVATAPIAGDGGPQIIVFDHKKARPLRVTRGTADETTQDLIQRDSETYTASVGGEIYTISRWADGWSSFDHDVVVSGKRTPQAVLSAIRSKRKISKHGDPGRYPAKYIRQHPGLKSEAMSRARALVRAARTPAVRTATERPVTPPAPKVLIGENNYPVGSKLAAGSLPKSLQPVGSRKVLRPPTDAEVARMTEWWGVAAPNPNADSVLINVLAANGKDDGLIYIVKTKNTENKIYTPYHLERQALKKYDDAKEAAKPENQKILVDAVDRDAVKSDAAAMLSLILHLGMRPDGSDGEGSGVLLDPKTDKPFEAYGASSLQRRHVTGGVSVWGGKDGKTPVEWLPYKPGGPMVLVFPPGKHRGIPIALPVKNETVRAAIDARMTGPLTGQLFPVKESAADAYLKATMKGKTSVGWKLKLLRTIKANELAQQFIGENPPGDLKSESDLNAYKKRVAEYVAENLGNTPAVALKNYIDPRTWRTYQAKLGLR